MSTSFAARSPRSIRLSAIMVLTVCSIGTAWLVAGPRLVAAQAVVDVATVGQLQAAVANLASGVTIRVAPGRYALTQELRIRNGVRNVAIVGATGNRDDVVIVGTGMATAGVNIALKVENAQDVRIADLSIGDAYWHPIQLQGEQGADRVHISNVRLFDAGQQFLKSTVNPQAPNGVDDVIVERSLIEYTVIGPAHGYTEGIDVHHGANWTIRHNVFRNIHVPATAQDKYRPAILMWSGSRDTIVHNNLFINCERGIIFGLGPQAPYANSHSGGLIYNNVIYRTEPVNADAGISIWDSPGTRVYHNTVIQNGTYPAAIEYRFPTTTGVEIVNNLTDGVILRRDNASGLVSNNYTQASAGMFVNAAAGDFHLAPSATAAIDQAVPIGSVLDDFDGDTRPAGVASDLGADERTVVTGRAPIASLAAAPSSGAVPLTVEFDGRGSTDPDAGPLTMFWSFGDGQTATGATVAHTYTQQATFVATLTVTDAENLSATASKTIVVAAAPTLAAPGQLRGAVTARSVLLSWTDQSAGETDYFVERATWRGEYQLIARLPPDTASYTDANLARGAYRYRVRAFSASNGLFSPYSNTVARVR